MAPVSRVVVLLCRGTTSCIDAHVQIVVDFAIQNVDLGPVRNRLEIDSSSCRVIKLGNYVPEDIVV
jgi:hypothetical protein